MADHSLPIRDALRAACKPLVADPRASDDVQTLAAVAATQTDLLGAMQDAGRLLIEVEDVAELMANHAKALRAALLDAMVESGAPGIATDFHEISYQNGAAGAHITGPVPEEFMRQPPPAPDKAAIAKALRGGQQIEGAVLRNAAPHLTIRAKKD